MCPLATTWYLVLGMLLFCKIKLADLCLKCNLWQDVFQDRKFEKKKADCPLPWYFGSGCASLFFLCFKFCAAAVELREHITHLLHCPRGIHVTSGWARLAIWGLLQGGTWAGHHPPRGGAWLFDVFLLCSKGLDNGSHAVFMSVKQSQASSRGTRMRDDSFVCCSSPAGDELQSQRVLVCCLQGRWYQLWRWCASR